MARHLPHSPFRLRTLRPSSLLTKDGRGARRDFECGSYGHFERGDSPKSGQIVDRAGRLDRTASLTIGRQPAQILYAGAAPYMVSGVMQVNAVVPDGIGSGPQPI